MAMASAKLDSMTSALDFDAAEELLLAAEFEELQPVWHSSNRVYLAQMSGPGESRFAAVYKPRKGERPLWDFPEGTLHRREVAAYRLSLMLGWPSIPPTVLRDGPGGEGSIQLFIDHDPAQHFFELREVAGLVPQLQQIVLFDYVANNADRKGGHCLLGVDGRIWAIDHGLCFHNQYKLRSVIWDWAGDPAPEGWLSDVARVGEALAAGSGGRGPLTGLLEDVETEAIVARIGEILESKRFPQPGPHRSYPWPLV